MTRDTILLDIVAERIRQDRLCREGYFQHTLAETGALSPEACLAVVAEEFGEVAEIVADKLAGKSLDTEHLRQELVQLAACCVAWVEQLDEVPARARLLPYRDSELPAPPRSPVFELNNRLPSYTPGATPDHAVPGYLDLPDYGGAL